MSSVQPNLGFVRQHVQVGLYIHQLLYEHFFSENLCLTAGNITSGPKIVSRTDPNQIQVLQGKQEGTGLSRSLHFCRDHIVWKIQPTAGLESANYLEAKYTQRNQL
jgi:hypothetical protein